MTTKKWGADCAVSMPEPVPTDGPIMRDYGGMGMTEGGMSASMSIADLESILTNFFGPIGGGLNGSDPS